MRKTMCIMVIGLFLFTTCLIGKPSQNNWIEISENAGKELFKCISSDKSETEVKFFLPGYQMETIIENGEKYQKITYWNEGEFTEIGKPNLPRFSRLVAIPDDGSVSVEVIELEDMILPNMNICPSQPISDENNPEKAQFTKDEEFYQNGDIFPAKIVELGTPAIMRDFRVVNLTVNPFQYNPQTKELRILKNVELKISYDENRNVENVKTKHTKISRYFEPIYRSAIINYDSVSKRDDYQQGSYLFIYPDDPLVKSTLQPLVNWKHQKGFEVVPVSTSETGTTNTLIKDYIQDAYDTWDNPPEFICLVGDADGNYTIPTWFETWSGYSGEGDHPYTQLEGNDILSDAFVGRLSFNTITEFQTIVSKILNYEKEPYLDQTDWYKSVLLVGDTSPSGQSCIITNKYIKELMLSAGNYSFTELYGPSPSVSQMVNAVEDGVSFFNYRGWLGMSGWSNNTTYSLNNGFMLPVVVTLTCGTGDFYYADGRTEVFLKAGTPSLPQGGIAAIGTATMGTHTRYNNPVSSGIYYGIFVEQTYNMGGALARGKLNLYNCFPDNPGNCVGIYSYWNNLMGDPGMEIWTDIPSELIVTYPSTIPFGSNFIEVSVTDTRRTPLSSAWVSALKGDDEIFSSAYTDENGIAIVPFEADSTGDVSLTVTKHNFIPHLGSFEIIQQDYSVNYYDVEIDDDNIGTSSGNNDGILNPGENVELIVSLKNFGSRRAYSVTAELSTESECITITDDYEDYGNIFPGDIGLPGDDFDIEIDPACLGGTELVFDLLIQDVASHQWSGKFYLTVEGPYLHPKSYSVIDGGNQILDPGETAELVVTLENIGSVIANGVNGLLMCSDNNITIGDSLGYFGNISAGGQATNNSNRFELTASSQIIPGSQFAMDLYLYNLDGYSDTVSFVLEVGEVTVTDPLGPDEYGYYCYDDGDTQYYNAPTYQWIEIDPNYGGSGTLIPLNDNGENQEDIDTLSLPFIFRFYGQECNEITVCSNGWIAMGQTEQATFRNWPIPGPMGPSPMIAPFWDDLYMGGGNVYYFYDTGSHYFVIEWSRVKNRYDNSLETFEVILYDPAFYPTSLNDGEIKFQYQTVNNVDQGAGYTGGHYATVGIENYNATIGIEYTYNNDYPTSAKVLEDEMALLFTGPPIPHEEPYIVLGGITINDANGNGLVDYGEDVNLDIALNNIGENSATAVYAILSSTDNYITITADSSNYNDISGGSSGVNLTDFSFSVADTCPDGHIISFQLLVVSNEDNWNLSFGLEVNAPNIEYSGVFVIDGDDNILDPGETADILVKFINNGGADAYAVMCSISTDDSYITINSSSYEFGTFSATEIDTATFNVTADEDTPIGHSAVIDWDITADYSYANNGDFSLTISQIPVYIWYPCTTCSDEAISDILDVLGISYDSGPSLPANLSLYSSIFVLLGIYSQNHILTQSEGDILADFLDNGGRIYMEGGDTWAYNSPTAVHPYFNIDGIADGTSDGGPFVGVNGTFTEGMDFQYSGANSWIDHLAPIGDAFTILKDQDNNYDAGIAYDGGTYKTIGCSFEFGGLDDGTPPSTKQELLSQYLDFFGLLGPPVYPDISVNPDAFSEILVQGDSTEKVLTIANSGNADLTYSISLEYEEGFSLEYEEGFSPEKAKENVEDFPDFIGEKAKSNTRASGGPDEFGYLWIDSDEPGGPVYDWIDISGVGIPVSFTHNDVASGPFDIGFDFTFYGETYDQFIINPNGWIGFGDDNTAWQNTSIPSPSAPRPAILAFWDDLDPLLGGAVSYYSNGIDSLVVWFNNVEHWHTTPGTYNFEIIIHSTGNIIYQYMSVSGVLNSATIGIQNESGTIGLEVAYNETYVHNNLALEFYIPANWLNISQYTGTVNPEETDTLNLLFDASALDLDDYHCDLKISSNDPDSSLIVIPVDLTVIEIYAPPDTVANLRISIIGDSVQLSWDPVTEDINGNPIQVDYYKIYSSQTDPYFSPSEENLIGTTTETSFNDTLANRGFYIVTATYQGRIIIPIKYGSMNTDTKLGKGQ